MIKLSTTSEILYSILIDKNHLWHEFITTQPISSVSLMNNGKFDYSEMDPVFVWSTAHNVDIISSEETTINISQGIIKEFDALYLLDLPSSEIETIRSLYGVLCVSVLQSPFSVLNYSNHANTFDKTGDGYKWKNWTSLFEKRYHGPSNAVIIVDRWFFNDVKKPIVNQQRYNLFTLLDSILPHESLNCQYQVLMYFEKPTQIKDFHQLSDSFMKVVKQVVQQLRETRTYSIRFEAIINTQTSGIEFRDATHNRIMLTNYSYIGGQNEWKIFYNNEPLLEQYLTFEELLHTNDDEKASENYNIKLAALVNFTQAFLKSYKNHVENKDLSGFKYAWIIDDKIYSLKQDSTGYTVGIEVEGEVTSLIPNYRIPINNRLIKRFLPQYGR